MIYKHIKNLNEILSCNAQNWLGGKFVSFSTFTHLNCLQSICCARLMVSSSNIRFLTIWFSICLSKLVKAPLRQKAWFFIPYFVTNVFTGLGNLVTFISPLEIWISSEVWNFIMQFLLKELLLAIEKLLVINNSS